MRISDLSSDVCSSDLVERAAEFGRQAGDPVRLVDEGAALVVRVAADDRQAEPVGEVKGEVAEHRPGVSPHIARRIAVEAGKPLENDAGEAEQYVERRRGHGVAIIEAERKSIRMNSRHNRATRITNATRKKKQ